MSSAIKIKANSGDVKLFSINKEGRMRLQIDGKNFFKKNKIDENNISNVPISCIDAIGLIILKKYFPFFIEYMSRLNEEDYNKLLSFNHLHFTMKKVDNNIEFTFHMSLLYDMMLESLEIY